MTSKRPGFRGVQAAAALFFLAACASSGGGYHAIADTRPVGPAADREGYRITTAQWVRPAGQTTAFAGRPIDLVLSQDGSTLYVKEEHGLLVVAADTLEIRHRLTLKDDGGSMHGIALDPRGGALWMTTSKRSLREVRIGADGTPAWGRVIDLPGPAGGNSTPCGIAISADGSRAFVCLSRSDLVAEVDLAARRVTRTIPVGVCPFDIVLAPDQRTAWVSNFGGRRPGKDDRTAVTAATRAIVDERGIASSGTITRIDVAAGEAVAELAVGLHPSDLLLDWLGARLFVANGNSDSVSIVDTAANAVAETVVVKPDPALPFGSLVNALALSPDEGTLLAACAGNNAVAVVGLPEHAPAQVRGFVPTGWFPGAVVATAASLFVANVRGEGSRIAREKDGAFTSPHYRGSLTRAPFPDDDTLARYTAQVLADGRVPEALAAAEAARSDIAPKPVPDRPGEPSLFQHVVFVLKENRTFDQVFGDFGRGNCDPALCIYGREVTPNQHALAERFGLLDNYYCNGVVSADGHQWATQGIVIDYQEKSTGGWTRSYDFGTDALAYAGCNFLWDNALLHGRSFRNYGEFDFPGIEPNNATWTDIYHDYRDGTGKCRFPQSIQVETLRRYSAPDFPGWELKISDQLRLDRWLREFRACEAQGTWQDLSIVYLPQDHTSGNSAGTPTPRAHVADNDLAVGRLVDAISHSRFWPTTCIFVMEDDPQNGWDHVDGHRSTCLVISPYSRRGAVISDFANQTAILHTIEHMLGLPPMNQLVAGAPLMAGCFNSVPDLTPFDALPNQVPLDEMNGATGMVLPEGARGELAEAMDFSLPDRIDDDALNRVLWALAKGPAVPYPASFAGPHGRGLAALGLALSAEDDDDER